MRNIKLEKASIKVVVEMDIYYNKATLHSLIDAIKDKARIAAFEEKNRFAAITTNVQIEGK